MKDTEIHNHLEKNIERDFFSDTLKKLFDNPKLKLRDKKGHETTIEYSIAIQENIIENAKNEMKRLKTLQACILLMEQYNWEEHEVSEYVSKSGWYFRSFIGTEEEYNEFIKQFE